jgi:hypothetical protein
MFLISPLVIAFSCLSISSKNIDQTEPTTESPMRVVAFGDVHGDINAALAALQLAGVIDGNNNWNGGKTNVVQVGDQLDRGDTERQILDLFETLRVQAQEAGGGFYPLLGNHEIMNVDLDFRYVTSGGFVEFSDVEYDSSDEQILSYPAEQRGRVSAFKPGGLYTNQLSSHNVILQLDGTIFVHGGILPEHVEYGIDKINIETSEWMKGEGQESGPMSSSDAPTWSRHYSDEPDEEDCSLLDEVLSMTGAQRMVVAHTVQETINPACNDKVWRVDVGMASHYGGTPQVLEIVEGKTTVIGE